MSMPEVKSYWGDGPDVSITTESFLLMRRGKEIAIDLTTAEAEELVKELTRVIELNKAFDAQFKGAEE